MALIPCKNCNEIISDLAPICPYCSARHRRVIFNPREDIICEDCGSIVEYGDILCLRCGRPINDRVCIPIKENEDEGRE